MNLKQLAKLLKTKTAKEIFGSDPAAALIKYSVICHPDKNIGNEAEAKTVFDLLHQKYEELNPKLIIQSKTRAYQLKETPIFKGDLSDYFLTADEQFLLKVCRTPKNNTLLKHEAEVLKAIRPAAEQKTLRLHFPLLNEEFSFKQGSSVYHCLSFENDPDAKLLTLTELRAKIKNLDPRHIGWIFNRVFGAVAWTHIQGYVHGAIVPQHVLVNPVNHQGVLIGWPHSVKKGEIIKTIPGGTKAFYPKETLDKKPALCENDVYMIGKLAEFMAGGDLNNLPRRMSGFFKVLMAADVKSRPDDVFALFSDWRNLLKIEFGQPKFVTLEI